MNSKGERARAGSAGSVHRSARLQRNGPGQRIAAVLPRDGARPRRLTVDAEDEAERGQRLVEVEMDRRIALDAAGLRQRPILGQIDEDDVTKIADRRARLDRNDRTILERRVGRRRQTAGRQIGRNRAGAGQERRRACGLSAIETPLRLMIAPRRQWSMLT